MSAVQQALGEAIAEKIFSQDKSLHMLPYYVSGYLDSLLMGVVISQVVSYWKYIRTDKRHIVVLIFLGVAGTTAASIVLSLWMQHLFVWNFGRYLPFTESIWLARYTAIEIITTVIVQTVYVDRACRLFSHWWPASVAAPLIIAEICTGTLFTHVMLIKNPIVSREFFNDPAPKGLALSFLTLHLTTDLLITIAISAGLGRLKTGWKHTDSIIKRLTVAIACLAAWNQQSKIALCFILIQTKIYVVGLLVTLNLRSESTSKAIVEVSGNVSTGHDSELKHSHSQTLTEHSQTDHMYPLTTLPRLSLNPQFTSTGKGFSTRAATRSIGDGESEHMDDKQEEYGSTSHLHAFARV